MHNKVTNYQLKEFKMLQIFTEVLQEQCLDHQQQKFQPTPLATGIGGGLSAATIMGMFGGQNTQSSKYTNNP